MRIKTLAVLITLLLITGSLTIAANSAQASAKLVWDMRSGPPTVASISPAAGPASGGTNVTITGTGFLSGATVTIGGANATSIVRVSTTVITTTTPAGTAGAQDIVVTNPDTQSATLINGFTYIPLPVITSISPNNGSQGQTMTVVIKGTNFTSATSVYINAGVTTNSFTVINSGVMTASITVANNAVAAPRDVSVTTGGGTGVLPGSFTLNSLFQSAGSYTTGGSASGVTVGDFNKDGYMDIAVSNENSYSISVLLNNGNGTFQSRNYSVGSTPVDITTGDFNKDSYLDLAVANNVSTTISVLLNKGTGIFNSAVSFSIGDAPQAITTGDFNVDGNPDIVVGNAYSYISVLLGNGTGSFSSPVRYNSASQVYSVVTQDFNKDGYPDIAAANYGSSVSIFRGNGDGTFQTPVNYRVSGQPFSIITGDFNRDGQPDLATVNYGGNTIAILLGSSNGTFQSAVYYVTGGYTIPSGITAADFNGDGRLDIAVANASSWNVGILFGNGDGTFQSVMNYLGSYTYKLAAGDLNGDGRPDLAVANHTSINVTALLNTTASLPTTITVTGISNPVIAGTASGVTVTVRDQFGAIATGYTGTVHFASSDSQATLPVDYMFTTDDAGVHTFNNAVTLRTVGTQSVSANDVIIAALTGSQSNIVVNKVSTTTALSASPNPSVVGQSVTFTATVNNGASPTGTITFKDGDATLTSVALSSGSAGYTTGTLTVGNHSITAVYSGDANNTGSTFASVTQIVNNAPNITLDFLAHGMVGSSYSQYLSASGGNGTYTWSITSGALPDGLTLSGNIISGTPTKADTFNFTVQVSSGVHSSKALSIIIHKASTTTSLISALNPSYYSQSVTFTATVSGISPTGTILFKDGDATLASVALSSGGATCTASTLNVGSHSITAVYGGDANNESSTSSPSISQRVYGNLTINTNSLPDGTVGIAYNQTLSGSGGYGGFLWYYDGYLAEGLSLSNEGVISGTPTKAYTFNFTLYLCDTQSPNNNYVYLPMTITINKASTGITLTSSHNPSTYGQSVTFTATVSGGNSPTGTVDFRDGVNTIASGVALSGNTATYNTSVLSVGSHSITAVYNGDSNNSGSTSTSLTQTVNAALTLAVNVIGNGSVMKSPNQETYVDGTVVTLTATPADGWVFSHWSGDATGATNSVDITMSGNKSVTANFAAQGVTLIGAIKQNPAAYQGQSVKISGGYRGWEGGYGTPPVTRSDWVLQDDSGAIYVTGSSQGLTYPVDAGTIITVNGIVRLKDGQPYLEIPKTR